MFATVRFLFILLVFLSSSVLRAQDSTRVLHLDEVVISVNKTPERLADIPQPPTLIKQDKIIFRNPATTADALQQLGNVYVQKSQQGGGSPVIRGFEANKILMVVDGVRLNNAIYRSGHLQNSITLDPTILHQIEVLPGAGSVQYGSDAIGGILAVFTKQPQLSLTQKPLIQTGNLLRYASANNEKTWHTDLNWGSQKLALLSSVTLSSFGDLRHGRNGKGRFKNFGDNLKYVQRINNQDSLVENPHLNRQIYSGYQQADFLQKILYQPRSTQQHLINLQYSTSSDIPRYDRLQNFAEQPRFAEWNYGPQQRFLGNYRFTHAQPNLFYDELRFTPAYQYIAESRLVRNYKSDFRDENTEQLYIFSGNLDLKKNWRKQEFRYGAEYVYNDINSRGFSNNIISGQTRSLVSRYPQSKYATAGGYISHRVALGRRFILSDGLRLSYVRLKAAFDPGYFNQELGRVTQQATSLNYNAGLVWHLPRQFRISGLVSTGFRNPNVDDLGKTFEQNNGTLIVANPNLKPEQIRNQEISLDKQFSDKGTVSLNFFYSTLTNAIVGRPFPVNNSPTVEYQGQVFTTQANVNTGKARVYGWSARAQYALWPQVNAQFNITQTRGSDITGNQPLDHIPPVFGQISIVYQPEHCQLEAYWVANGLKHLRDYSVSGEDNLNYAPVGGSPGWQTWNVKAAYTWQKHWTFQAGIENILDHNYRPFASGINAAGRNFILAVRFNR